MMKSKRWFFLLVVWVLSSVMGCILITQYAAKYTYQHPFLIQTNGLDTVVVDDNDQRTNILKLNDQNQVVGKISYDRLKGGAYHLAWKLFQGENAWYLAEFNNEIGESSGQVDLYYLDFEKQEMVLLCQDLESTLKEAVGSEKMEIYVNMYFQMTVQDDALYLHVMGVESDTYHFVLTFQFQNGTYKLDKKVACTMPLRDGITSGDTGVFLYQVLSGVFYKDQQLSSDNYSKLVASEEGNIYAVNQTTDLIEQVVIENADLQINQDWSLNRLSNKGLSLRGVRSLSIINEENYAAAYYDMDMPRILLSQEDTLHVYGSSQMMDMFTVVLCCVLLCLGLCVVEVGGFFLIRYLWGHGSVVVKILAALIPVMLLVSSGSIWVTSSLLSKYNEEQDRTTMNAIAQEVDALGAHQKISDFHIYLENQVASMDESYMNLTNTLMQFSNNIATLPSIWDQEKGEEISNENRCVITYYGLDRQENTYFCVYGNSFYMPLNETMAPRELEFFLDAVEQGTAQVFEYYSETNQKFSGLIYPSRLEDGTINGFYLIYKDQVEGENQITQITQHFVLYQLLLCALLLLLFTPIIYFSLKPLSNLRKKANLLMQGKMPSFSAPHKGVQNEISDLSLTFQRLAEQVGDNMAKMRHLQGLSKAYFSPQILKILGKESVAQLYFDESVTLPLYVAYIHTERNTFDRMQQLTKKLISWLEPCDGFFASVTWHEIVLVSQKNTLFYAAAAAAQEEVDLRIAFDYTPVVIKVLGAEPEYRFLVTPENKNRAESLCMYRDALHCRLLATEGSFPMEQSELSFRKVGLLDQQGLMECFLDSFAHCYRLGQKDLEKGVGQFFRGELLLARASFIQALRFQPGDPVAIYYIELIDAQINQMQKEEHL